MIHKPQKLPKTTHKPPPNKIANISSEKKGTKKKESFPFWHLKTPWKELKILLSFEPSLQTPNKKQPSKSFLSQSKIKQDQNKQLPETSPETFSIQTHSQFYTHKQNTTEGGAQRERLTEQGNKRESKFYEKSAHPRYLILYVHTKYIPGARVIDRKLKRKYCGTVNINPEIRLRQAGIRQNGKLCKTR